jgi:hypothetical protein
MVLFVLLMSVVFEMSAANRVSLSTDAFAFVSLFVEELGSDTMKIMRLARMRFPS